MQVEPRNHHDDIMVDEERNQDEVIRTRQGFARRPPNNILRECSSIVLYHGEEQRVYVEAIITGYDAGVYSLTFPLLDGGNRKLEDLTKKEILIYCKAIEKLHLSKCFAFPSTYLFLKIVAVFDEEEDGHMRLERIYQKVTELEITCVRKFYFLDDKKDYFVIVSDKAQCDLQYYLENTKLSLKQKINLCVQYTELVRQLHENDIVHGDLKPKNVLVLNTKTDECLTIKLTDFEGSSCLMPNGSYKSINSATLGYFDLTKLEHNTFNELKNRDLISLGINIMDIMLSDGTKSPWKINTDNILLSKIEIFNDSIFGKSKIKKIVSSLLECTLGEYGIEGLLRDLKSIEIQEIEMEELFQNTIHVSDMDNPQYITLQNMATLKNKIDELSDQSPSFETVN